ncbi:methyltransferase family protein [Knoellia sp. LjRoot47]|uniref:methyltransferase family protein n=1 Tax=Knoellia sp. LjRoot47 TaxID=3342330 RepID=UPI003ED0C24B
MSTLAIGVYGAYLLIAFGARTLIQVLRTGDTGFRGLSGRPGSAAWWAGILFVAALVAGVGAPVAGVLGLAPIGWLDHPTGNRIGLVVAIAGVALTLAAQLQMGTAWRIGVDENERTSLVTTGVFGIVRNPIFTAMCITALGLTLMVPNVIAVAGILALAVALELQVRIVEEPYLRTVHGDAYRTYEIRTGRFLPTVRPARPSRSAIS